MSFSNIAELQSAGLKVLLVEDQPISTKLVAELLKKAPRISLEKSVTRLSDAVALAPAQKFDVILLDLQLEDSTGYETFSAIQEAFPDSAILVLSASENEELALSTVRNGAQDYLVKGSFDRRLLIRAIHHAFERKQSAEALRKSELTVRAIFESSLDAIVITDAEGRLVDVNAAAEDLFGERKKELVEQRLHELCGAGFADQWEQFQQSGRARTRVTIPRGAETDARLAECCFAANILPGQHLAVFRDITEQQHLEEQLRSSQKMEAIGRLAGGVAHEFNNMLAIMSSYTELLDRSLEGTPLQEKTRKILVTSQRAASLVNQLLAFGHKQVLMPTVLDVRNLVQDISGIVKCIVGVNVQLTMSFPEEASSVKADRSHLEQIILSMAENARDAMPQGGSLAIQVQNVSDRRKGEGSAARSYVLLSIADSGIGMDEKTRSRIFEPFFTTKKNSHGLGLSTVYGIVQQSGGHVIVHSEPGAGTTFHIYLPAAEEAAGEIKPDETKLSQAAGNETILVVDDETQLRDAISEYLESCGYRVLKAENGSEAVSTLNSYTGKVSLIVSDVVMPEMNGRDLLDFVRGSRPETKVLLISGYTDDVMIRHGISLDKSCFLQKPFTLRALAARVRSLLEQ